EHGTPISSSQAGFAKSLGKALLRSSSPPHILAGLDLVTLVKLTELADIVRELAEKKALPDEVRLSTLDCLAAVNPEKATPTLTGILADASESKPMRERAAQKLAALNRPEAQAALLANLALAPAPLQNVIAAGLVMSPQGAEKLLDAVVAGKAS